MSGYLNHKSFHPGSFQNIEAVWIQEQKHAEQTKIAAEKAKKLQEERNNEALKKLQVQAGLLPPSALDRQEWIHDWGNKVSSEQAKEEDLLGKSIVDRNSRKYSLTPMLKEGYSNSKSEAF